MKVGIVGGGLMGLATAFYLSRKGFDVTVLEKEMQVGGLSRSVQIMPGLRWDRFYHVILSTDTELLRFIGEIGLSLDVNFQKTRTGFYTNGALHSMSSTWEFLRFKPLSPWDKLRLAVGILYVNRVKEWTRLEKMYVKTWLVQVFGRRVYEKMWDPLLRSKLGAAKEQAAASFIWAVIKRLYGIRHSSSKTEFMGCVREGYYSIFNHVMGRLKSGGAAVLVGHSVECIKHSHGRLTVFCNGGRSYKFDRVITTVPNPEIVRMLPDMPAASKSRLNAVRYLSLICLTLVLKKSLSPFYITNLTDSGFPFTGIIEATNVIPSEVMSGRALMYLPRYMAPDDPFFKASDKQVFDDFMQALKRVFPDLADDDVITHQVNRERVVQPLQDIGYSEKISPMITPIKNLYMVNTTMIHNSTLNNNQVVRLAGTMAELLSHHSNL